jgi:hypothetical protein
MTLQVMTAQTGNGNYWSAKGGGGGAIDAAPTRAGRWETFSLLPAAASANAIRNGDPVGIRVENGMFLSAENGGGGALSANRPWLRDWETFYPEKVGGQPGESIVAGDSVHFRTADGHYVCAEGNGGGELNATRSSAAEWETFRVGLTDPPAEVRIRIDVVDVSCRGTEDVTGADELYLMGVAVPQTGDARGILTGTLSVNDGETKSFPTDRTTLFDGTIAGDESVAVALQAYDEDVAHDWQRRASWVNDIGTKVGAAASGAAVAALATNPIGWSTIGAVAAGALVAGGFILIAANDKDDQLGVLNVLVPAVGAAEEVWPWRFSHAGGWWSSWDYTVRYRIRRG